MLECRGSSILKLLPGCRACRHGVILKLYIYIANVKSAVGHSKTDYIFTHSLHFECFVELVDERLSDTVYEKLFWNSKPIRN